MFQAFSYILRRSVCFFFLLSQYQLQFRSSRSLLFLIHTYSIDIFIRFGKHQDSTRKQNNPAQLKHKSVMKKEFPKIAKVVSNQVGDSNHRPDLKKAALSTPSVVNRGLHVEKSGVKKKTKQATRIPGMK